VVGLLEEPLDRRLLPHERHDDLAVERGVLRPDDDEVAVEDAGLDHRVAPDREHELAVVAIGERRHVDVLLDVLLRQDRLARGDGAHERQPAVPADHALRRVDRPVEQLDRPRLRRVAPQQAHLLQVGQMGVHGRGRGQADRLADVAHRGRVAVAGGVLLDEVEDLLLALRQVLADVHAAFGSSGSIEHVFGKVAPPSDGYKRHRPPARLRAPRGGHDAVHDRLA
jgi:hypothetical protein